VESWLRNLATPDLVWVPCFRQRDVAAAQTWARKRCVPVVFDPLISAYDKKVFERGKFAPTSRAAHQLLQWERQLMGKSDLVVADTSCHADFFQQALQVAPDRLAVIPVSAEEEVFTPQPSRPSSEPIEVLFYGSFIGLQGPHHIAEAVRQVREVRWTFIGAGPLLESCQQILDQCDNVRFLPSVPYDSLPQRIAEADILLGIFGTSDKAARVIPNKVSQALACGRPVVTQLSDAYPTTLRELPTEESGISWVPPGQPQAIADTVRHLAGQRNSLGQRSRAARLTFDRHFSNEILRGALNAALQQPCIAGGQLESVEAA
jgi:glycosyltransferase involved in cell wall biosynthesis